MSKVKSAPKAGIRTFLTGLSGACQAKAPCFRGGHEVQNIGQNRIIGDLHQDADLPFDRFMAQVIRDFIHLFNTIKFPLIKRIVFEGESDPEFIDSQGHLDAYIDPCDASLDAVYAGWGVGLPYSVVVTLTSSKNNPLFKDIVGAAVIDLRPGVDDYWSGFRGSEDNSCRPFLNERLIRIDETAWTIDDRRVFGFEMYYPQNRRLMLALLGEQKGYFRNCGSAGVEMAMVSSGQLASWVCCRQKLHELGAGWFLVKGAGGWVRDFTGQELDEQSFVFNSQKAVILAATPQLGEGILQRVQAIPRRVWQ